ncbi:YhdP family protein [Methylococcus sp. EFPC2]|uniref:YhdP family protein n=1 Tax=Methylococcus sp. EFPC2 TaxID=2812648 RepID=UPI0019680CD1|nr:YhdP family protein [Methylococcus sp. EFPC2]QSA97088.1 TIGR02099 family protein [Methylococcus sp. EFPC2]
MTRYVLLSLLVASALALSVIRFWLIPQAAAYRVTLASEIAKQLGAPVEIGTLAADMRGFEPVIVLKGFSLLDPTSGGPALSFERLCVRLDLPRTVLSGRPVWRSLSLEGARVVVRRDAEGRFGLLGVAGSGGRPAWLMALGQIELRDIELGWRDERTGDATRWLGRADFMLENEDGRHGVNITLDLPVDLGGRVVLAGEWQGLPERLDELDGRFYVAAQGLRPGAIEVPVDFPWRVRGGSVDFALWGEVRDGQPSQIAGRLTALKAALAHHAAEPAEEHSLVLNRLQGDFLWQATKSGWQADFKGVRLALFDQPVAPVDLALAYESTGTGSEPVLRAAATRVSLDDLRVLLDALPLLNEESRARVRALALQGELSDVRLAYTSRTEWALCTRFDQFGAKALDGLPGGRGLSGSLCGNDRHGRLRLALRDSELGFRTLWPKDLHLSTLDGELGWRQDDEAWSLNGEVSKASAPGLNLAGRFLLVLPKDGNRSPFLSVRAGLRDVHAAAIRDYLPVAVMPRLSANWLTEAFEAGRVPRADFLFHGYLRDFPFANGEGVLQAQVQAEGMELDFNPEWPHLYDVHGLIAFRSRGMVIEADAGRIGDAQIRSAHAEVGDLVREDWLAITGEVETTVPQAMQFLSRTPLRRIPEHLLKAANPAGTTAISLNLQVPISEGMSEVRVDGRARLTDAALELPALGLTLSHIQGDLGFRNEGLAAQGIRAQMLDEPVDITVEQSPGDILIGANGRVGIKSLTKTFPALGGRRIAGQAAYRLELAIPETMDASSRPFRMHLASDLNGLSLELPAPLGKIERSKRDFQLDLLFQQAGRSSLQVAYGSELKARFALADTAQGLQVTGGELAVGAPLSPPGGTTGLRLHFDLPELNLAAWATALDGGQTDKTAAFPLAPDVVDISIDRCTWDEKELGHLDLRGSRSDDTWRGTLDTLYGKGRFELNVPEFSPPKLTLDLDTLKWPKLAQPIAPDDGGDVDPSRLPALKLRSKQTLWQGSALGVLDLEAERWTQGLNIRHLTLGSSNHQLKLKGRWMKAETGPETSLDGSLDVKDMGRFVEELGYGREIRDTESHLRFNLNWPGGPQRFSAARVAGHIDMKLGKGGLLQVEPGLGRVIGMLNLSTLSRRLRLDFSDMFGKGLAYDSVAGRFTLGGGQARTESFLIEAAAANIFVSGRAGLVDKDLDMQIAVVPHTSVALPIAGTLAGGPAVGAAVLLAQRLVGDEVDAITASHYEVSGPWNSPRVTNESGYMPMDMINRAWSGLKELSGFESQEGELQP